MIKNSNTSRKLPHLAWAVSLLAVISLPVANAQSVSQEIDRLVEAGYKQNKIKPNPPTTDDVFVRRAYLDIIGRVPTLEEIAAFQNSEGKAKRAKLVNQLMDSEGFVSHFYNYWADVLRIKSRIEGEAGAAYADWVKEAVRTNKPYNEFVGELITADGYVWDNGAVGYYMRDAGMPLDNMAHTAQVFLGTRMVCAQCHDHPFDKWTQMDYYKMAAYTYGVSTRIRPEDIAGIDKIQKRKKYKGLDRNVRRALNDILEPLSYGVRDTSKEIKLPHDYKYDDAEPKEVVKPDTPFGEKARKKKQDPRHHYAAWMTGSENPRFTTVIVNRLWKRAMGVGLIEPLDDFRDDTKASNPALMRRLERLMVSSRYDMRKFLKVVYSTRTYQREATKTDVDLSNYHFPGPALRRMTAEQLWDSVMTVAIPSVDQRKGQNRYQRRQEDMKRKAEILLKKNPKDIIKQAQAVAAVDTKYDDLIKPLREAELEARKVDDKEKMKSVRKEIRAAEDKRKKELAAIDKENAASESMMMTSAMNNMSMMERRKMEEQQAKKAGKKEGGNDSRWKGLPKDWMRASELPSPAPSGHFLRQFGQSDRETIENAEIDATVAQVLTLMNGSMLDKLTDKRTVIMKNIAAAESDAAKGEAIFLTLLGRKPAEHERALLDSQFAKNGAEKAAKNVIWALLNTREFAFVQ